jgi:hypothetical protein
MANDQNATITLSPAQLSPMDWARFGLQQVAYLRPVMLNGVHAVSIHAADGTHIGAAPNLETAAAAVVEHEMAPVLVH